MKQPSILCCPQDKSGTGNTAVKEDSPHLSCLSQVIMRDTVTRKPRGFGFITFAQPEAADAVCAEQHTIDGRQVQFDSAALTGFSLHCLAERG